MMKEEEKSKENIEPSKPIESEFIQRDPFLKMAEELTNASEKHLCQREQMNESLKEGYDAFNKKKYRRAIDCYKEALKITVLTPLKSLNLTTKDVAIINYIINLAKVESNNYEKIVQAIRDVEESQHLTAVVPAFFYLLGKAYYKLNRFKQALEPLKKCEDVLQNQFPFASMCWPTTDVIIKETRREGLEECVMELIHLCSACPEKPTAVCRYNKCSEISSHIIPSDQIYFSDPDFIGYISLTCDGKCNIQYHVQCWKAFKETFSAVEKVHDKDMLVHSCPTTDCVTSNGVQSKICLIEIIGQDGKVKTQIKSELPQKQNVSKNLKKRKQKLSEKEEKPSEKTVRCKKTTKKMKTDKIKNSTENAVANSTNVTSFPSNAIPSEPIEEAKNQRLVVLEQLRAINFGCVPENLWDYCAPYYGRDDEKEKKEKAIFIPPEHADDDSIRQFYKDFVLSWFYEILCKEGPMKVDEIQDQWISNCNDSEGVFGEVKLVLTDVTNVSDLLLESTRFCLIDDYICSSEQLPETYKESKTELTESVLFMISENLSIEAPTQPNIPLLNSHDSHDAQEKTQLADGNVVLASPPSVEDNTSDIYISDSVESFDDSDSEEDNEIGDYDDSGSSCGKEEEDHQKEENYGTKKNVQEVCNEESSRLHINEGAFLQNVKNDYRSNTQISVGKNLKSVLNISTQTDENNENYMKSLKEKQLVINNLKSHLITLSERDNAYANILKKIEGEKRKLIEEKKQLVSKYNAEIAIMEEKFAKEKQKLEAENDKTLSLYKGTKEHCEILDRVVKNLESVTEKHHNNIRLSLPNQIQHQFHYFNTLFEIQEDRQHAILSELHYLSKLDYLPCHNEVLVLIEEWKAYSDLMSKCRIDFNSYYDKVKKSIPTIDVSEVGVLFVNMLPPLDIISSDPGFISKERVIQELIEFNMKNRGSTSTSNKTTGDSLVVSKKTDCGAKFMDQNMNLPCTSTNVKNHKDSLSDKYQGTSDSELSGEETKSNIVSRAFEFRRNKNNEKSTSNVTQAKKQKSTSRSDPSKNKASDATKNKVNELPQTFISETQQSKKLKKGKTKAPQLFNSSSAVENTISYPLLCNSIWGSVSSSQEWRNENNFCDNTVSGSSNNNKNINNNGETENDGEWQVIVDKKSAKEHSACVVPLLTTAPKNMLSYTRLIERLKKTFSNKTEKELSTAVKTVREQNNCSLSGLSMDEIEFRVEKLFAEKSKKPFSMGMEKFGENVWGVGGVSSVSNWQCTSNMMEECVICCEDMGSVNLTTLECNHPFHTECIRQWLKEKSVCPLCNKFTKMPDEFPAL